MFAPLILLVALGIPYAPSEFDRKTKDIPIHYGRELPAEVMLCTYGDQLELTVADRPGGSGNMFGIPYSLGFRFFPEKSQLSAHLDGGIVMEIDADIREPVGSEALSFLFKGDLLTSIFPDVSSFQITYYGSENSDGIVTTMFLLWNEELAVLHTHTVFSNNGFDVVLTTTTAPANSDTSSVEDAAKVAWKTLSEITVEQIQ